MFPAQRPDPHILSRLWGSMKSRSGPTGMMPSGLIVLWLPWNTAQTGMDMKQSTKGMYTWNMWMTGVSNKIHGLHKRFIYEVHSKKFWDVEHDVELSQKWDYTYVPSKVTLVTAQNVIIPYHLLFDQTALEMFDRMVCIGCHDASTVWLQSDDL